MKMYCLKFYTVILPGFYWERGVCVAWVDCDRGRDRDCERDRNRGRGRERGRGRGRGRGRDHDRGRDSGRGYLKPVKTS